MRLGKAIKIRTMLIADKLKLQKFYAKIMICEHSKYQIIERKITIITNISKKSKYLDHTVDDLQNLPSRYRKISLPFHSNTSQLAWQCFQLPWIHRYPHTIVSNALLCDTFPQTSATDGTVTDAADDADARPPCRTPPVAEKCDVRELDDGKDVEVGDGVHESS